MMIAYVSYIVIVEMVATHIYIYIHMYKYIYIYTHIKHMCMIVYVYAHSKIETSEPPKLIIAQLGSFELLRWILL